MYLFYRKAEHRRGEPPGGGNDGALARFFARAHGDRGGAAPGGALRHGFLDQKELRRIRISLDELISEVRQSGLSSLDEVDYAILEQNGKISIIPKKSAQPPTAKDMHLAPAENGIVHTMVADGKINRYNLQLLQLGNGWVDERLQAQGWGLEEVFFLGIDDSGKLYWIKKGAEE